MGAMGADHGPSSRRPDRLRAELVGKGHAPLSPGRPLIPGNDKGEREGVTPLPLYGVRGRSTRRA
jgi:hypothetical protein